MKYKSQVHLIQITSFVGKLKQAFLSETRLNMLLIPTVPGQATQVAMLSNIKKWKAMEMVSNGNAKQW